MFYEYNKRMDKLKAISKLTHENDKIKALEGFIAEEIIILQAKIPPAPGSQALTSAQIKLHNLQRTLTPTTAAVCDH